MRPLPFLAVAAALCAAPAAHARDVFPLAATVRVADADTLEDGGRTPAYLLAVAAARPEAAETLAHLVKTVLYGGTLPPSLKLAMGLRVANDCGATYAAAHLKRLADATPVSADDAERTQLAVGYAADLTRDIHGVSDASFARIKGRFNDAQVVELTMATCFFNYFTRLTIGLGVKPEPWLATTKPKVPAATQNPLTLARVTLASDEELQTGIAIQERFGKPGPSNSLGVGIPNSVRAMVRVPDLYQAWLGRQTPAGPGPVPRSTLLQVSLAVSTVNGCRYCVLHQVVGLRRQGVEIGKLVALQKDDSALTPDEKAAVDFARKLTKSPGALGDADRAALQTAFPGAAAFEVLHQTCRFAFMNRFTDGLRLPSEDEAVHIYREVYGTDYKARGKTP